jgi:glycerol uptake facilitator protein
MSPFIAEILGSFLLILMGNGVVANLLLTSTKGNNGGWVALTIGWGLAVFVAVFVAGPISGAHINPAVTLGLAMAGDFAWELVPGYMTAQMIGTFIGAVLVWLHYRSHFTATEDQDIKLAVFATAPAIRSSMGNLFSEVVGTFVLVFGVLNLATPDVGLGSLDALPVGLLVLAIGLSLGGTTGYAINPARDLGPRIAHALLPISGKGSSDWGYAWIPVVGPLLGGAAAALLFTALG